jgi:hypothetical protein
LGRGERGRDETAAEVEEGVREEVGM